MIAKRLESLLAGSANLGEAEMLQRFQKLRDDNLLPKSRGRNAEDLTMDEITVAILSIGTSKPGYAALSARVLADLRPARGANFMGAPTFRSAIRKLIEDPDALRALLEVKFPDCGTCGNAGGVYAEIRYLESGGENVAYYVHKTALSDPQRNSEKPFNPRGRLSPVISMISILPALFRKIAHDLAEKQEHSAHLARSIRPAI